MEDILRHWIIWVQMVAGQVSTVGSVGSGVLFQKTSLHTQATMTLPSNEHEGTCQNMVTHIIRRAKNEKIDAFLAIDVCTLEIMISGKTISAVSVSMFVISR